MAAWYVEANVTPNPATRSLVRGCIGKIPYTNRHAAEVARVSLYRRPANPIVGRLNVYHCNHCSNFHLGRDPRQTRPRS